MTTASGVRLIGVSPLERMLNDFLRREISAVDSYWLAVGLLDGRGRTRILEDIAAHHAEAARFFRTYLLENGGQAASANDAAGRFAGPTLLRHTGGGSVRTSPRSAISALREGEFATLLHYRRCANRERRLTEEVRDYLHGVLIPRCALHLDALELFDHV